MHEFGFTSIHGFVWGSAFTVFHRVAKLFPEQPYIDAILYGAIGLVLSRYALANDRAILPANKPMTSAEVRENYVAKFSFVLIADESFNFDFLLSRCVQEGSF